MAGFDPYDALVPIFLSTDVPRRVHQIGSAVFVKLFGELFLITAAHVIDELQAGELLVPTEDGLSPIEGYMAHIDLPPEVDRSNDSIDIAYFRLSVDFGKELSHHFTPLPQNRTRIIESAFDLRVCSASGYPASKGRQNNQIFSSEIFSFRGVAAGLESYNQFQLSPTLNIVLHFHKKRAVNPETFESFPGPSLKGISGGGIFAWPEGSEISDDWTLPNLVGLVHTFKEREGLIIGTTLVPILAAISLGQMKKFRNAP